VSLYYVQKYLYQLNRDPAVQDAYRSDPVAAVTSFVRDGQVATLTDEEIVALTAPDIGLLYHLGVNGQILMHFAAFHGIEWTDYLQRMRQGLRDHGPVREGVYALTTDL
jgi:hypothetical protein